VAAGERGLLDSRGCPGVVRRHRLAPPAAVTGRDPARLEEARSAPQLGPGKTNEVKNQRNRSKKIPIHELKASLSEFVAQAESGVPLLITRHRRVVAQLGPADAHVHVGARCGTGALAPLLTNKTKGRYLDVVADDRRGGWDDR